MTRMTAWSVAHALFCVLTIPVCFPKDSVPTQAPIKTPKCSYVFVSAFFAVFTFTHPIPNAATNAPTAAPAERY